MKDESRQPTSLRRLEEITSKLGGWISEEIVIQDSVELDGLIDDATQWLVWTSNFLSARKMYHKKARIRTAMLEKMAKTLLSKGELDAIDNEAEKQLGNLDQPIRAVVGVCKEDDPEGVDEAYGEGTYARLFPKEDE